MRGKVTFAADGAEHVLQFTTNRLCDLEEQSGRTVMDFAQALGEPGGLSFVDIRLLMQIGLGMGAVNNQAFGSPSTKEAVGGLIDEIGLTQAMTLIARAFAEAFNIKAGAAGGAGKTTAGAV